MIKELAALLAFNTLLLGAGPAAFSADNQSDTKLIEKGRKIWLTVAGIGCAGCHGRFGEGDVGIGSYNRGVGLSKIQSSIAAVDQMRMLQGKLNPQDIEAVAAYNSWLGQHQLVKTLVKRDRFEPDTVDIFPGTAVQLVINNSSQSPRKFAGPNMNIPEFQVSGREMHDLVWQAPDKEGTYTLLCLDCRGQGEHFTINVRRSAKPYRAPEKELK
ncbi:MAG: hypothetical protein HYS61_08055 [Acidobacteria bacterium]|nr:hypothetical protein [Acidobacteriota bacterium]